MKSRNLRGILVLSFFISAGFSSCRPLQTPTTHPTKPTLATPYSVNDIDSTYDGSNSISPEGPWFMYLDQGDEDFPVKPAFINIDGSGYASIEAPLLLDPKDWGGSGIAAAPRGGHIALLTKVDKGDLQIWIYRLPELSLIERIPIISSLARRDIILSDGYGSYVSWYLWAFETMAWSPNGRYLTFPYVRNCFTLDLHVFDTETGSIKRLSNRLSYDLFLDWSPDSHWIVYSSSDGSGEYRDVRSIWAASADGRQVYYLYSPSSWFLDIEVFGWPSNHSFLSGGSSFESGFHQILETEISTQTTSVVLPYQSLDGAVDPITNIYAANAQHLMGFPRVFEYGLYLVDLNTDQSRLFHKGFVGMCDWKEELGLFSYTLAPFVSDGSRNENLFLITPEGTQILSLDYRADEFVSLDPSPNGDYFVVSNIYGDLDYYDNLPAILYTADGVLITELEGLGAIFWTPDSSAFLRATRAEIYLHSISENWNASLIDDTIANVGHFDDHPVELLLP